MARSVVSGMQAKRCKPILQGCDNDVYHHLCQVWKEKTQLFNSYAYQRAGERVDKMDYVDLEKQQLKEHVTQLESDLKRAREEKEQAEKRAQEEKAQAERREKELSVRIAALEAASLAKLS